MDDAAELRRAALAAAQALQDINAVFRRTSGSTRRDLVKAQKFFERIANFALIGVTKARDEPFVTPPRTFSRTERNAARVKLSRSEAGTKGGSSDSTQKKEAAWRNGDFRWEHRLKAIAHESNRPLDEVRLEQDALRAAGRLKPRFRPRRPKPS